MVGFATEFTGERPQQSFKPGVRPSDGNLRQDHPDRNQDNSGQHQPIEEFVQKEVREQSRDKRLKCGESVDARYRHQA